MDGLGQFKEEGRKKTESKNLKRLKEKTKALKERGSTRSALIIECASGMKEWEKTHCTDKIFIVDVVDSLFSV